MKAKHKLAIHELLNRAAYYFDARDADALEACFVEDAKMQVNITGGQSFGPFEDRDAIMALMHGTWEAQTDIRRHIICDVIFEAEGAEEATVVSTVVVSSAQEDGITIVTSGVYRDLVRKVDKSWRIANRNLDLDSSF